MERARHWWSTWVSGPPSRWVSFSLLVAILLLVREAGPSPYIIFYLVALIVLLALSLRWRVAPVALIALLLIGIDLRLEFADESMSDVDQVTRAAIGRVLAGQNPYGVGYDVSDPAGSPFPYGPLVLLWYMPWHEPAVVDFAVSIAVLALLVLRGHMLGAAIYATLPVLLAIPSDGSNDTSAGFLLLIALVAFRHAPAAGAFLLGLAIAFKPYALAWAPGLVVVGGLPALIAVVAGAGLFWVPAMLLWSPWAILQSFAMSQSIGVGPWYSLGAALTRFTDQLPRAALEMFSLAAGAATALAVMATVRSWRGVIIGGSLVFLATMFLGYWASWSYYSAIAPIVCWYLDEWLGMARQRVAWPMDPVGRFTAAVNARLGMVPATAGGVAT